MGPNAKARDNRSKLRLPVAINGVPQPRAILRSGSADARLQLQRDDACSDDGNSQEAVDDCGSGMFAPIIYPVQHSEPGDAPVSLSYGPIEREELLGSPAP